ncbi:hypothetical protein OLF87_10990, partial [Streptococcus pneumoniae]|nr:hypothetical protein [Streptococcus pneumoniae]
LDHDRSFLDNHLGYRLGSDRSCFDGHRGRLDDGRRRLDGNGCFNHLGNHRGGDLGHSRLSLLMGLFGHGFGDHVLGQGGR